MLHGPRNALDRREVSQSRDIRLKTRVRFPNGFWHTDVFPAVPFVNNKKARQALVYMADQQQYLQAAVGPSKYFRQSGAYFVSKSEFGSNAGSPPKPDFERARQLMKEARYDGKPIVVVDPTNIAMLHAVALVTGDLLQKIGCKIDVQAMDWGTLVARRGMKTPASEGGVEHPAHLVERGGYGLAGAQRGRGRRV
jgi:peptide/nickel transport system substrate-binding protein